MKLPHAMFALVAVILLAGCSGTTSRTVNALNRAEAVGNPFSKYMTAEYRDLARRSHGSQVLYFARKGLAAADGVIVMPENINDWNLGSGNIVEVTVARAELVDALENGGRDLAPEFAAVAQSRFDCWLGEQETRRSSVVPCKEQFFNALNTLKAVMPTDTALSRLPPLPEAGAFPPPDESFPSPVTEAPRGEAVPVQDATFLVFFDWNKYNLSSSARDVLKAVTNELDGRKDVTQIVIVGHTDTSGKESYNDKLSLKRAQAARSALIAQGIAAKKIRVEGRGEKDLLVKTPDNIRQPENRRAQITLE